MAQREAAELDAQASENDWRAARLAICVAVAQTRWQLGYLHRLRTQAFADLHDARSTLELTQIRYRAGAISGGDQVFARQSVVSQQATLSQLEQQIVETRHAFALLMGAPPESPQPELDDLPDTVLPVPAAGLPVDLLSRRADVHAAELRVRSSLADADATRLSFYPSLTLTGSYGTSSPTLTQYLANPIGQLAAALTLPFVQFNTARLSNQSARVAYEAESVSFRKTLYRALQETEDALSARVRLSEQAQYLNEALALTQEAERVTFSRWQLGRTDIQPWLDAKGARRRATLNLMQNTLARRNNAVQIYAALGGDYHQRQ
jgi:outer membrane protein TolC